MDVALRLETLLSARSERVRGLIRNPEHAADFQERGPSR